MRIGFLSDIHGNREALDACIAHAKRHGVDRWVVLGDLVGYGADPAYVVDRVRELVGETGVVIKGNHDAAAAAGVAENMNEYATSAVTWTYDELDDEARDYLRALPMCVEEEDRLYVHSDATKPAEWRYVSDAATAERSLRATDKRLTFCGHIHIPQLYHMAPQKPAMLFKPQHGAPVPLVASRKWLMVQGAVGQPRDRNPAAAYGVLDVKKNEMSYMRVPYDIESAARKIHSAGLPQLLAARLYIGR
jgi:diadenosine tetraphosphatase ApaH/serine/threonine PP2A family protein phosphatase